MDIPNIKKVNIQKLLNDAIYSVLYGGSTDAGYAELESAAAMYTALKNLNLTVIGEANLLETLRYENIYHKDFLELFIEYGP